MIWNLRVQFPGRAGELQAAGRQQELDEEVGSNYPLYHQYLAARLATLPRAQTVSRPEEWQDAINARAARQDVLIAELYLRQRRAAHLGLAPDKDGHPLATPMVTPHGTLASVEDTVSVPPVTPPEAPPFRPRG